MNFLNCSDHLLAGTLADSLVGCSSVLSISVPGNGFGRYIFGANFDFVILDALSEYVLNEHPWVAREHRGKSGLTVVAQSAGNGYIGAGHRLGTHRIAVGETEIGYCALGDLLERLRNLGLVHFGPSQGHCGLLLSVVPQLVARSPLVWLELPVRGSVAQVEDVCEAFSREKFEIFGITRSRVVEMGLNADAVSGREGEEIAALVLVSQSHSARRGLDMLAQATTEDNVREALAVISMGAGVGVGASGADEARVIEDELS